MKPYAFGVDLGGTTVKIGFFSSDGILKEKWEIPTRKEDRGELILPDIAASIKGFLDKQGITISELEGIGIDVPGAVLEGGIVDHCANLGWGIKHVSEELSDLMDGLEIFVANDANAAALGEMKQSEKWKNIVMVTLGTGVGGGVIVNGRIVTGTSGGGGEIGHITVEPNETARCGCGKRGCLEQYVSATGIVRLAGLRLQDKNVKTILRESSPLTSISVFDAAKKGDETAQEILEEVGEKLGRALAAIACVVDPEAFVIGGGVSKAGPILIDMVQKYYRKYAFHTSRDAVFALASLGNDAGMYGSVQMVIT